MQPHPIENNNQIKGLYLDFRGFPYFTIYTVGTILSKVKVNDGAPHTLEVIYSQSDTFKYKLLIDENESKDEYSFGP